jgi:sterol desaturase/sphingolipid hydroxylase (fatty acid hydroxylase superfamily)
VTTDWLPTLLRFGAGLILWPLLEYAIHGWLSHRFQTFVSPLHWEHHRDPRRVFTSVLAWAPGAAVLFALLSLGLGMAIAAPISAGALVGFLRYEYVHWRIHFREPRNERQRTLKAHHLAHHFCDPKAYYGVTTRVCDRLFGSLPAKHREDYARVADRPPLRGRSNFGRLLPRRAS